jgi:hypothetical protein
MNKVIKTIILTLIGAGCFSGGVYYGLERSEHYLESVMTEYEVISDKVYAFEKVSDPKTIRLYVKELNKLLDDMNKLSNIVNGGDALNIVLTNYQIEYNRLQEKLSDVLDEVEVVEEEIANQNITLSDFTDVNMEKIAELKKQIQGQNDYTTQVNTLLGQKIEGIEKDVIIIKDSKYGKKIWKVKKK